MGWGVSSYPKQFCDTSWVFCYLIQFWHCPLWDSIWSPELSTLSHTAAPSPKPGPGCHLSFWLIARKWRFPWLLLELDWYRTHKISLFTVCHLTLKGYDKGHRWTSRWMRCIGQGLWSFCQSLWGPLSQHLHPRAPATWRLSRPCTCGVLGRFHRVGMTVINSISPLSPLQRVGLGLTSKLLTTISSHPGVTTLEQETLLSSRKCQGI